LRSNPVRVKGGSAPHPPEADATAEADAAEEDEDGDDDDDDDRRPAELGHEGEKLLRDVGVREVLGNEIRVSIFWLPNLPITVVCT
jgi:hypothetical protein